VTLKPFVNRVLKDAIETGVDAVIFQIDTFGGRVDAAVQTRVIAARVPSSSMKLSLR
jgi:membrane-bound serine protease (ClpP class)